VIRVNALLERLFVRMLRLYPSEFHLEFGDEMRAVFTEALAEARSLGKSTFITFVLREVIELPASLAREYRQLMGKKEGKMANSADELHLTEIHADPGGLSATMGKSNPSGTWLEYLLAALPNILVGFIQSIGYLIILSGLMAEGNPMGTRIMNGIGIAFLVVAFGFSIYAWRVGWPRWTGSWLICGLVAVMALVVAGIQFLQREGDYNVVREAATLLSFLLLMGYALYRISRQDGTLGLLAALPFATLTWSVHLEFVPLEIKTTILISTWLLVGLIAAGILASSRRKEADIRTGVVLALATNAIVGLPYAWAGIYHGGTLPFSAPGPSLAEVMKSYLPHLLGSSTLIIGPLLATRFSELGRRSGKSGVRSYHLALFGMLVLLIATLVGNEYGGSDFLRDSAIRLPMVVNVLSIIGVVIFLIGYAWLFWATQDAGVLPEGRSTRYRYLALLLVALCLPSLMFMISPVYSYLNRLPFGPLVVKQMPRELAFTIGVVWLVAAAWLVGEWEPRKAPLTE
jgi:hypothetical protein